MVREPDDNFAEDIEEAVTPFGEPIEAVIIGWKQWGYKGKAPEEMRHRPLSWEEARPLLDYQYYSGYGTQECDDVFIYTASRVFYVHEYDGSTYVANIPRNPSAYVIPEKPLYTDDDDDD